uniref:ETFB lysine methyltransferase n=1 Tax=Kalanchoe fedtschenkoi TaxID=63787 RepID=A0A7N0UQU3_KALFE
MQVCITCTFSESEDVGACISLATNSIGLDTLPSYLIERGDQSEWIKKTQESFHPLQIIKGVWVVPEWQTPPESDAINIILNPGLAFGTGQHPTTKLCLVQLHKVIKAGDCILDYGTGSGILAIASLKFGAASSVAVDIDPLAIASACQNAALNNIPPEKMQLLLVPSDNYNTKTHSANEALEHNSYCKDAVPERNKYDVVIANILLNPLLELAESIVSYAKPGAFIALSGVLIEQIPQIMERYSPFVDNMTVTQIEDYACITGTKIKDAHAA